MKPLAVDFSSTLGYTKYIPPNGGYFMQTTVVKWGNSQGIRLPKAFLQSIQIAENDPVYVTLEDEKIVIRKYVPLEHKTTKKRLIEFYGEDFNQQSEAQEEIDWGRPVGGEVW